MRVYEPRPVDFRCGCSARKVEDVLRMLGEEEARQTLEAQGNIEVICEYCGAAGISMRSMLSGCSRIMW